MKLEQSFHRAGPGAGRVGRPHRRAARGALPAGRGDHRGPPTTGATKGTFTVKLGPTTAIYNGTLKLDEPRRGRARGDHERPRHRQARQGGASATIVSTLHDDGTTPTRVEVIHGLHDHRPPGELLAAGG